MCQMSIMGNRPMWCHSGHQLSGPVAKSALRLRGWDFWWINWQIYKFLGWIITQGYFSGVHNREWTFEKVQPTEFWSGCLQKTCAFALCCFCLFFCTFDSTGSLVSLFPWDLLNDWKTGGRGRVTSVDGVGLWSWGVSIGLLQGLDEKLLVWQLQQSCLEK